MADWFKATHSVHIMQPSDMYSTFHIMHMHWVIQDMNGNSHSHNARDGPLHGVMCVRVCKEEGGGCNKIGVAKLTKKL